MFYIHIYIHRYISFKGWNNLQKNNDMCVIWISICHAKIHVMAFQAREQGTIDSIYSILLQIHDLIDSLE